MDDFDRVWDAEMDDDVDEEQEEETFDTVGGFNFAPRTTDADASNDRTSLNRKLDECLYLLIKNNSGFWTFPSMPMNPKNHKKTKSSDITPIMKKYAMQSIKQHGGSALSKYMLPQISGAPIGFHWSVHEDDPTYYGSKHYFFKSQCYRKFEKDWPVINSENEYVWVTKDELHVYFAHDEAYLNHIVHLL
jgi:hypothetical protein